MGLRPTLLLGFIAGVTILLGLPVGRLRRPAPTLRALLNAVAVGVLLFLVWDVLSAAWEPIDAALGAVTTAPAGWAPPFGLRRAVRGRPRRRAARRWSATSAGWPRGVRARRCPRRRLGPGAMTRRPSCAAAAGHRRAGPRPGGWRC